MSWRFFGVAELGEVAFYPADELADAGDLVPIV
jgi:hypothetical protein